MSASVMVRPLLMAALVAVSALGLSCNVNEYCIGCDTPGDGGGGDGGLDADDGGMCTPTGIEICDGKDDDCDGLVDEGLTNLGSCGLTDVGECALGTKACMGGSIVCIGLIGPSFELCDNLDQDCDGNPTNGFDLMTDPTNCGMCGNICNLPNAFEGCAGGACTIAACQSGFHNNDGMTANGCEFGPCTIQSTQEVCNGADDNCNGMTDEGVSLPPVNVFCRTVGECAVGTTVSCDGMSGLRCHYTDPDVSVDAMGNIIDEVLCDGKDNDCDGAIDEGQPNKGQACDNGQVGDCRSTGTFQCNAANPSGPAVCVITSPGPGPSAEACDGRDNNCNGTVDEGAAMGNLPGQEWVTIPNGGGVQIMKYEASRPDASAAAGGTVQTHTCSRAGVQPWTSLTYPQAVTACSAVGARLCTEAEWQKMCEQVPAPVYPVAGPVTATDFVFLEAEDAFAKVTVAGRSWIEDTAPYQDSSGRSYMYTLDNGVTVTSGNAPTQSPRLDFRVNLTGNTTYFVWVRLAGDGTASDSVWVGINLTAPGTANNTQVVNINQLVWEWRPSVGITTPATTGIYTVSVYMREDGASVDGIAITLQGTTPPPIDNNVWAFATNPKIPQAQTCNGDPYDTTPGGLDDDGVLPTGSLPNCFANGPGTADAFDMSGNVKEWTAARAPGQNPIRGGASNNEVNGLACGLNFTLANDSFFFPNTGFRCCR